MSESKARKEELELERKRQREQEERSARLNMRLYGIIAAVILIAGIALTVYNSGLVQSKATAVTVNGTDYTAAEVQYFYNMELQNVATYAMYGLYDFDLNADPADQIYDELTGETWEDYLKNSAKDALVYLTAVSEEAKQAGYTMSEAGKDNLDSVLTSVDTIWVGSYANRDAFLRANYGPYMTYEKFVDLMEMQALAADYVTYISDGLSYTEGDYEKYYNENKDLLDTYTITQFVLQAKAPTAAEGEPELSAEEKAAGLEAAAAEKAALAEKILERLTAGEDAQALADEYEEELFSVMISGERTGSAVESSTYANWAFDPLRRNGDITSTEYVNANVHNYYVVRFEGRELVEGKTADVRHMLIAAEVSEGASEPTEAQYAAAKEKAEAILNEWKAGEATEESFAALATVNTADTTSAANGGLMTGVSEASGYIQEFTDWCMDTARKSGDTGIVKNTGSVVKGWHIMYYVNDGDPVWKQSADSALRGADYTVWETGVLEGYEAVEGSGMKYV